jgi:hypothetical protein
MSKTEYCQLKTLISNHSRGQSKDNEVNEYFEVLTVSNCFNGALDVKSVIALQIGSRTPTKINQFPRCCNLYLFDRLLSRSLRW